MTSSRDSALNLLIGTYPDETVLLLHEECIKEINMINDDVQELSRSRTKWSNRDEVLKTEIKKRSIGFAAPVPAEPSPEEASTEQEPIYNRPTRAGW